MCEATMCLSSQMAFRGCVTALMCTVALLTPNPDWLLGHIVGKVGERADTDELRG